jgi:hypothetical protein
MIPAKGHSRDSIADSQRVRIFFPSRLFHMDFLSVCAGNNNKNE